MRRRKPPSLLTTRSGCTNPTKLLPSTSTPDTASMRANTTPNSPCGRTSHPPTRRPITVGRRRRYRMRARPSRWPTVDHLTTTTGRQPNTSTTSMGSTPTSTLTLRTFGRNRGGRGRSGRRRRLRPRHQADRNVVVFGSRRPFALAGANGANAEVSVVRTIERAVRPMPLISNRSASCSGVVVGRRRGIPEDPLRSLPSVLNHTGNRRRGVAGIDRAEWQPRRCRVVLYFGFCLKDKADE